MASTINWPTVSPPTTDVTWNPKNSHRTALTNACIKNGMTVRFEQSSANDPEVHNPQWISTCYINDQEYGRAVAFTTKSAHSEAARQALLRLEEENPAHLSNARAYYPIFMDYTVQQHLTNRITFVDTSVGPDHHPSWSCGVVLDDEIIGEATGRTKREAREAAVVAAANGWGRG